MNATAPHRSPRRLLAIFAALLLPFVAHAQVGIVNDNWSFKAGSERYGAMQITYPGPSTYTFFYFGKREYHVRAPASLLAAAVLVPLAATALILAQLGRGNASRKNLPSSTSTAT
jgi:hypothetical protein